MAYRELSAEHDLAHPGTMRFPPAVILKTVVPTSEAPEPPVTPLKTVIWPPFGNDSALVKSSVTSLPWGYRRP